VTSLIGTLAFSDDAQPVGCELAIRPQTAAGRARGNGAVHINLEGTATGFGTLLGTLSLFGDAPGCAPQIFDPGRTDPVAGPSPSRGVIALARIVLRSPVDLTGLIAPSATPLTRRRIGEPLDVRAGSVPGGSHHEYSLVPAFASSSNCGAPEGELDRRAVAVAEGAPCDGSGHAGKGKIGQLRKFGSLKLLPEGRR
jgi:hypothetical protein